MVFKKQEALSGSGFADTSGFLIPVRKIPSGGGARQLAFSGTSFDAVDTDFFLTKSTESQTPLLLAPRTQPEKPTATPAEKAAPSQIELLEAEIDKLFLLVETASDPRLVSWALTQIRAIANSSAKQAIMELTIETF